MPAGNDCTRRANQPASTPTSTPLKVEPITIPTIPGAVSGADTRADRPSKIPRKPPSMSPSTGLFIESLPPRVLLRTRVDSCTRGAVNRETLPSKEDRDHNPHDQIRGDEENR